MELHARTRFTLVWRSASRLPAIIDAAAATLNASRSDRKVSGVVVLK